jgi:hypothetical protein
MRGGFLHVGQRHPGIERCSDERVPERAGRDSLADPSATDSLTDDPPSAGPVRPPPVRGQGHWPAHTVADGQAVGEMMSGAVMTNP